MLISNSELCDNILMILGSVIVGLSVWKGMKYIVEQSSDNLLFN